VILKVVGSIPTVARHIFHQACPVWIYTQSNISQAWYKINFNFSHQNDQMTNIICKTSQLIPLQPPWPGIFFKLVRCGYTLRVTSQASYSPETGWVHYTNTEKIKDFVSVVYTSSSTIVTDNAFSQPIL
jgi:hypothetical protein